MRGKGSRKGDGLDGKMKVSTLGFFGLGCRRDWKLESKLAEEFCTRDSNLEFAAQVNSI